MLVVTMTSWVKRINNVKPVVESVMRNTVKPDRVYLNLSSTEFNGIELPKDLVDYFNSDSRLVINWVDGENTKTMKKVFPILKYLKDDDIIINIDDDTLLPEKFIEHRYKEFLEKKTPITSCNNPKYHYIDANLHIWSCGAGSIFSKKMLDGWEKFMDDNLIHTYNDDHCYSTILWLNGYMFEPCSSFFMQNGSIDKNSTKLKKFNPVEPLGKRHGYIDRGEMYNILNNRILKMFGVGFEKSFGIMNKRIEKHDCVMVYGKSGVNSQEMTCGEHLEIEYVIASLKKFCSSWVGRIFIVGSEPPEQIKNDVIHIPCDNPYTHCKDANIIHKLRYACEKIPDLSEDFLMISDDQIVTRESSWEDMKPRIVRKYSDWSEQKWERNRKIGFWQECLYKTLKLFPKNTASFWEPHIWSPMNKHKFVEMCKKYDYTKSTACISQSLYYNYVGETPTRQFDHIHIPDNKVRRIVPTIGPENVERHLSWSDGAFSEKRFRDLLEYIVGFKDSFDYKTYLKNDRIMQLRKDIRLGNVVHVYTGDGKFVWKKVNK